MGVSKETSRNVISLVSDNIEYLFSDKGAVKMNDCCKHGYSLDSPSCGCFEYAIGEYCKDLQELVDKQCTTINALEEDVKRLRSNPGNGSATDWESVRIDAALGAVQGMMANQRVGSSFKSIAECAVELADEVVKELKRGQA